LTAASQRAPSLAEQINELSSGCQRKFEKGAAQSRFAGVIGPPAAYLAPESPPASKPAAAAAADRSRNQLIGGRRQRWPPKMIKISLDLQPIEANKGAARLGT